MAPPSTLLLLLLLLPPKGKKIVTMKVKCLMIIWHVFLKSPAMSRTNFWHEDKEVSEQVTVL